MARANPTADLAAKLVETLRQLREAGDYPVLVSQLAARADPAAAPAQVKKALRSKGPAEALICALASDWHSPVAFAEDARRVAASDLLLRYLLAKACSPRKPRATVKQLQGRLPDALRQPFADSLAGRRAAGTFPEGVGCLPDHQGGAWYLTESLPPPLLLAVKMVRQLAALRRDGGDAYPPTLSRLVGAVDAAASPDLVRKALADKSFKAQTLIAAPKALDGPVALAEDAARLAEAPALLSAVVAAARSTDNQAVTVAAAQKKVIKSLQPAFAAATARRLAAAALPAGVACLRIKKKPHLFLLADIGTHPSPLAPRPSPLTPRAPADFAELFNDAFTRLDRARGGHNLVSLVPLRQALPVDRLTFDAGLEQLRHAGRYVLSAAEGRLGISEEERVAGVVEDGALLLYVSKRMV